MNANPEENLDKGTCTRIKNITADILEILLIYCLNSLPVMF